MAGDLLYPTHVDVSPSDVAAEAATIGDRALVDAGAGAGRIDSATVLAALRLQALAARRAHAGVDTCRGILTVLGWTGAELDAATDFLSDPTMRLLSKAAETPGTFVRLEIRHNNTAGAGS